MRTGSVLFISFPERIFYVVIPDIFYRESILFIPSQCALVRRTRLTRFTYYFAQALLMLPVSATYRRLFWQKWTKPLTPSLDTLEEGKDAILRRADQLAAPRQGPQNDKNVRPIGLTKGVGAGRD